MTLEEMKDTRLLSGNSFDVRSDNDNYDSGIYFAFVDVDLFGTQRKELFQI